MKSPLPLPGQEVKKCRASAAPLTHFKNHRFVAEEESDYVRPGAVQMQGISYRSGESFNFTMNSNDELHAVDP